METMGAYELFMTGKSVYKEEECLQIGRLLANRKSVRNTRGRVLVVLFE